MIENLEYSPLNIEIFNYINNFALKNDFLDYIFVFMGQYLIYIIIIIFFIFFSKKVWKDKHITFKELVVYLSGAVTAYFITSILKENYDIMRPFMYLDKETLIEHKEVLNSFPSGHTTFSFALAISIFVYEKKMGLLALILALLVAFGRILIGVHFPLDVLVGMFVGIIVPIIIFYFWKFMKIRDPAHYYGTEEWKRERERRRSLRK